MGQSRFIKGYCANCKKLSCQIRRKSGLCIKCNFFPSIAKSHHPLPDNPTDTLPGTSERVTIYEQRRRRREQLNHPDDLQDYDGMLGARSREDRLEKDEEE